MAKLQQPDLYTITIEVRRVIDGIVQTDYHWSSDEGLYSTTAQPPRGDLQHITNIARGLCWLASDQLQSIPE